MKDCGHEIGTTINCSSNSQAPKEMLENAGITNQTQKSLHYDLISNLPINHIIPTSNIHPSTLNFPFFRFQLTGICIIVQSFDFLPLQFLLQRYLLARNLLGTEYHSPLHGRMSIISQSKLPQHKDYSSSRHQHSQRSEMGPKQTPQYPWLAGTYTCTTSCNA